MPAPKENRSAKLAAVLARALPDATPHAIERAVQAMQDAARAHKRHAENQCNYPMAEAQMARAEKRLDRLEIGAAYDLSKCGVNATHTRGLVESSLFFTADHTRIIRLSFGGDPRGPCGRLIISDIPGDGWGDGWAIYA